MKGYALHTGSYTLGQGLSQRSKVKLLNHVPEYSYTSEVHLKFHRKVKKTRACHVQDSSFMPILKATTRSQGHLKGPSSGGGGGEAFVTDCIISCCILNCRKDQK